MIQHTMNNIYLQREREIFKFCCPFPPVKFEKQKWVKDNNKKGFQCTIY